MLQAALTTGNPAHAGAATATRGREVGALISKVAFASTALFAAQLYLSPAQWFPVTQPLHIALVLSLVALGSIALKRVLTNRPLWLGFRGALLAIYVAQALFSTTWALSPPSAIPGAVEVTKHFLFFVAVLNSATTPARIRTALTLYAIAAIVPGWGTYWNYAHGLFLVEGFRGRWLGVLADPNHDAMGLVGAVPILLYLALHGRGAWRKVVAVAGIAACILGIVATHSRGGSIGLAVAVVLWALLSKHKAAALGATALLAGAVVLFAPATFWHRNESIVGYGQDSSVRGRLQAWQVAGRILRERPVLGVGEQSFLAAWRQYAPIDAGPARYVAHNLFLEVLGELGLLGFLPYIGFLAASLWSGWRARNGEMGHEARAVLAALVGYIVCQQFSGYSLSWFLYALCGFAACIDHWAPRPRPAHVPVGLSLRQAPAVAGG